jgi:hypothetical protein
VLARGHGRVVLVADDVEPIARWIAVVSYSLPVAAAARMSFVTYSADPDGAAQRLVGTTPDVWAAAQRFTHHVFHIAGGRNPRPDGRVSRFADTVAGCWRDFDFAGLDALSELAPPVPGAPPEALDQAAALLALCRGDRTVTAAEEAGVARLLSGRGHELPDWVWRDLSQGAPAMGLDLALIVHGRAPATGVPAQAIAAALAEAGREARHAALTPDACDLLYEDIERLRGFPSVALPVLVSVGRRRTERRLTVTDELLHLGAVGSDDVDRALAEVWKAPPSASECLALLERHEEALAACPSLAALPSRTLARLAAEGDGALSAPATLRLAARVRSALPAEGEAALAAAAIQAYTEAVTADGAGQAALALTAAGASAPLADDVLAAAAGRLARRGPGFRAELLAAVSGPVRSRLGALWTAGLTGRARSGRSPVRGTEIAQRNELMEVVLRLRRRGVAEPALETWARSAAGRWLSVRQLDAHFSNTPELRAALRELISESRGD